MIIIRQAIQSSGFPVGPILALSYKNHAIDEFLVDVLKNNSNLNTRGKLIRLGKPENELLVDCTEKKSALETKAHRELESRLSLLKKAYGKLQRWILSRDIAVQVNESDIAECLMICFHHLSRENLEQESEQKSEQDSDDYSDSNYDQIIEMNFEHLRSLLSDCENLSLEKVIPLICGGVEHWRMSDERPRSLQLLKHWIQGDVPPPRCQAFITEDLQCNESTQSNADSYCERYHSCLSQNCMRMRSPRSPRYCDLHSCAKVYCENMHYPTIPYCIAHSCYVCLQSEREVGFVCKEHSCNINGCTNSVVGDFRFCIDHCCLTCVELQIVSETSGVTQGSKYCSLHRCIYPGCVCKVVFENGLCQQHSCQYCDEQVTIGSKYCQSHTCNLEDCFECIALTESGQLSIFCQLHTCKYCALNECDLNRAVSLTTYTCYEHQLCCFIYDDGKECSNLVANGSTYCETHQNLDKISGGEFCSAITKKGKPCRSKRPDDCLLPFYFCKDHIKQAPNMTNAPVKATNDKVSVSYVSLPPVHHYWQSRVVKTAQIRRCSQQECSVWCYQVASSNKELYCKLHSLLLQVQPTVNVLKVNPSPPPAVNIPPIATPDRSLLLSNFSFEECKTDQPLDNDLIEDEKVTSSNLDEMQWEGDEFGQDDDIPTQTKHFEEIYQEEHDETTDIEFAQNHVALQDIDDLDISECIEDLKACSVWKWDMSTVERQQGVFKMVTAVCAIVTDLIHYAEEYVDEARKLKAEASAYILKEASVIGSTVVGAARRLAALRAAEPFAIIVEEACEVMEPTLVAVLAVESVKKLELIGDHRQLPAFVNQCWYNLECSIPSIKTSLFERIIMSENDHGVIIQRKDNICSILDMQRRMRTSISNLTKGEYQDLIAIQDHPATQKQKIGDKLSVAPPYRKFWIDGGRSVPGFQSCVYFWNMENNSQSRPIAGLSACNENEGLAVVELVKYLQLCGVPGQCITVITPYDGQKRLLIQLLRKNNCLPRDRADNTIHVSTVDRYQGDENDIVILSLVRTRPGNRFVGLLNRFIVATSRARLGFFIVGSISAVVHNNEGPRHWKTFIDHLSHPDTSGCDHFQSSRVGSSIPICCPVHHESTANVSSIKEARVFPSLTIWNNFCKVKCLAPLDCGHHCQLPCHLPELDKHTSECKFLIPRPCPEHSNIPLFCHTIQRKKGQSLENALRSWKCDHPDILQLPCGHEVELPCNVIQDIINTRKYPRCDVIVEDFIFSRCGHTIPNPKCYQRQQYLVDPPQCKVKVNVKRRCGHEKKLKCYQNDGSYCESIPCEIVVHTKRPRCKHPFNINCQDYQELIISLDGGYDDVRVVNGVTIVDELGEYGPSESSVLNHLDPCHVEVAFRRLCGHTMKIKCDKAFSLAGADNLPCADPTQVKCLLCRGNITIPCRYVEEYLHYLGNFDGVIESVKESNILETFESKISITRLQNPTLIDLLKKAKCTSKVLVHRSCHPSHNMELSCSDILRIFIIRDKVLQNCTSPYPLSLDCGHSIDVNCSKRNGSPPLCRRPNFEEFRYPNCEHAFIPKTCGDMRRLRNDPNLKCTREVSCLLPRCHHTTTVQCCDVSSMGSTSGGNCLPVDSNVVIASEVYCQPCEIAPVCYVPVTFQFDCGHQVDQIPCYEAFDWTNDPSKAPLCATSVSWCNPLCGHEILVTCGKISTLSTWNPWLGREKPVYPQMTLGEALVEVISYPPTVRNTDPIALNCGVKCNASVAICFEKCEHVRLVQCHELYDPQITLKCSEIVEINCPNCNLPRKLPCHDIQNQSSEEINLTCKNKCNKICQVCNITSLTVPCNQQEVSCKKDVECTLNCGHIAKWKCGKDDDPRLSYDTNTMISLQCKVCATSRWKMDDDLELDLSCMLDTCRKMFSHVAKVNDVCTILDETVLVDLSPDSTSLMNHERARHQLISKLNDAILKGDSKVIFPSQYGDMEGYIRSNYRLVYLPIPLANNPPADQLRNRCRPDSTPYGKGKMINVFDSGSLSQTVSLVNGQGKLCLGLAFQAKVLRDTPPFVINNGSKELNQQANKSSLQYMKQGYDAVEILKDNSTEMVYWNHESILPLLTLKIQLRTCCPICGDYFARSSDDGVVCPNSHFQCFECFRNYLEAAKQPDAINTYINDTGEVTCPECRSGYSLYQLNCEKCPQDIFQTLHNILLDHKLRKNEALIRQEAENKMKEELERIQKMSEEDREVHIHREQIISEILTPKCPRPQCRQAFLDFDGCFALTCGNQQCQCGFCAWCFKDCGTDAHGHVANCPYGIIDGRQLSVYGDISQLRKVWNRIRKEKIRRQLSNVSQRIRTKILQSLEKEFRDIGLKMD